MLLPGTGVVGGGNTARIPCPDRGVIIHLFNLLQCEVATLIQKEINNQDGHKVTPGKQISILIADGLGNEWG